MVDPPFCFRYAFIVKPFCVEPVWKTKKTLYAKSPPSLEREADLVAFVIAWSGQCPNTVVSSLFYYGGDREIRSG